MNLLPKVYFWIIFFMSNTSCSMDKLNKDIAASETEINRISKERVGVLMNNSISMDVVLQLDKAYYDALQAERINHEFLKQRKADLQKKLSTQAKL